MEKFNKSGENSQEKLDPNTFSPLPSSIEFNKAGGKRGDLVIDKNTGTEYFLISGKREHEREIKNVEAELFVSLLSKGIFHVSDVIEKDGEFYSKKMPLENMKPGEKMELEAENFLLYYIYSDWDHKFVTEDQLAKLNKEKDYVSDHHNLIEDKRGAFAHFDYDVALGNHHDIFNGSFMFRSNDESRHSGVPLKQAVTIEEIKRIANLNNQSILNKLKGFISGRNTKQLIKILDEKTDLFIERINDKDFFNAIIKKSKLDITLPQFYFLDGNTVTEKEESLRKYFNERLEVLKEVIN